eukprot:TRINITY_DN30292_c0_g1_i1.p1 TRINITY_DN30292_c0_g1~~TRINITY_DN30292_c0_g1_i1.p1  ORF type:complete len:280 (-),score=53.17 TRINITY_DN30292_c0_g1_i1:543-1382(-)
MSRYDNPFDTGDNNPYAGSAAGRAVPAPPAGAFTASALEAGENLGSNRNLKQKEKELLAKELALQKKEEELRRREQAAGIDHVNWPPCFPILHHDIANDIPVHLQSIQRAAYWSWLGIMFCLLYNIAAVAAALVDGAIVSGHGIVNLLLACLHAVLGWPLSYWLWYRRLYTAMRKDGAISFAVFFLFYVVHILFVVFASVAPPIFFKGGSLTGVYSAILFFADGWNLIGILYSVGAGFFILESLLSIYVLQQVYAYFRGNRSRPQMQGDVALAGVGGRY